MYVLNLQPNGPAPSASGLPKRAASCDVKLVVMEEVAPRRTPLRSGIRIFCVNQFAAVRCSLC